MRTSRASVELTSHPVTVQRGEQRLSATIEMVSLDNLIQLDGIIVVTSKSYANPMIAQALKGKIVNGPIVILQNGVGVEQPFLDAGFTKVYRCVLYATGQAKAEHVYTFSPINPSPIGVIRGDAADLARCVETLTTATFPFRVEANIQRETWKKAIINAVFNSVCPLLDIDNGVFVRDDAAEHLAREIIHECVAVADRLNLNLSETELLETLKRISQGSSGQLISTLQDIKLGRPTEIDSLNLEIARVAATLQPSVAVPRTEFLGKMILAKSRYTLLSMPMVKTLTNRTDVNTTTDTDSVATLHAVGSMAN